MLSCWKYDLNCQPGEEGWDWEIVTMVGKYSLWMPKMPLILWIDQPLCGTWGFSAWPRCARFLFNTYRGYASLIVQGSSEFILSKEGVAQGDPRSMLMYTAALLPLIKSLTNQDKWVQNWYADDFTWIAKLPKLREWLWNCVNLVHTMAITQNPVKQC